MIALAFLAVLAVDSSFLPDEITPTMPTWTVLVVALMTGGTVAALFTYLGKRTDAKAASPGVEATANLTGVEALTNVITTLSTENGRLTVRLTDFSGAFERVESKLDLARDLIAAQTALLEARPTKEDLIAQVGRLIEQLAGLGARPTNGPTYAPSQSPSAMPDLSPEAPPEP